jgi:hypothetical protein
VRGRVRGLKDVIPRWRDRIPKAHQQYADCLASSTASLVFVKRDLIALHAQVRASVRSSCVNEPLAKQTEERADFSIEKYGERTEEKEECEEQLLAEYAALLGFFVASVAVLTGAAVKQDRLPKRFGPLDLALLGIATHKLSRIVAKDRITGVLRAPFVCYIRSAGAGEVEEEPRGHGMQRGIGNLISCPYCMAPWCATALGFGLVFAPRVTRLFGAIFASVAVSDFLSRAYLKLKEEK